MSNCSVGPWISCVLLAIALTACSRQVERKEHTDRESSVDAAAPRLRPALPAGRLRGWLGKAMPAASATATFGFGPYRQYQHFIDNPVGAVIYEAVAAGDFNGDRRADLVALGSQNEVDVLLQNQDGTFAPPLSFTSGTDNYLTWKLLIVNDFNSDGVADVAFDTVDTNGTSGGVGLLLSKRGQQPVFHQGYPPLVAMSNDVPADWASLDVDGDGRQDIVVSHSFVDPWSTSLDCESDLCPNYEVLHGDGRGNFGRRELVKLDIAETISSTLAEDVNRDGLLDMVFAVNDASEPESGRLLAAYRLRAGGLDKLRELHTTEMREPIIFGDINGDSLRDTLMGTEIHLRNPDGSFGASLYLSTYTLYPATPVIADFNGDGLQDLVNHQFEDVLTTPFLAVYLGGGGTLQAPFRIYDPPYDHAFHVSTGRHPYATGDFNGDGCRDLVVAVGYDGLALLDGNNCIPRRIRTGGVLPPRVKDPG